MTYNAETDVVPARHVPDLMTLAAAGPQPGWLVLDAARAGQFTGEIAVDSTPKVRVYLDNGIAYFAVRDGEASLCSQLLEAGIVDVSQIERGVVRVGNVEHLGRLFDRDPSVDRDAVMVLLEIATDAVLTDLANRQTASLAVTAYRHHSSGVHRWFVAPTDPTQLSPVGEVAQIDGSVTSRLPGLPVVADRGDDLHIEWDEPIVGEPSVRSGQPALHELDESMLQSILNDDALGALDEDESAGFDPDTADWTQAQIPTDTPPSATPLLGLDEIVVPSPAAPADVPDQMLAFDDDFQIVWPDGTEQVLPATVDATSTMSSHDDPPVDDLVDDEADLSDSHGTDDSFVELVTDSELEAEFPSASNDVDASMTVADEQRGDQISESEDVLSPEVDVPVAAFVNSDLSPPVLDPTGATVGDVDETRRVRAASPEIHRSGDDEAPLINLDVAFEPHEARTAAPAAAVGGPLHFEMPALALSGDSTPSEHQPDEVVDAVRRALDALASASTTSSTRLPSLEVPEMPAMDREPAVDLAPVMDEPVDVARIEPVLSGDGALTDRESQDDTNVEGTTMPSTAGFGAFAPPTLDMAAEAVYARAAAEATAGQPVIESNAAPASGVASVVFVDDEVDEATSERSSALRRLIGSLRRK